MLIEISVLIFLLVTAIFLVTSSNLLNTVVFSGFFSILCALLYLLMLAPDVALTEAAIGACVTTCFFLGTLRYLKEKSKKIEIDIFTLGIFIILTILLVYFSMDLHEYGYIDAVTNHGAVDYYKKKFAEDTGLLSMVNSILASYRGFDTFGETVVVFVAGMCVLLICDRKITMKKKK